MQPEGGIYMKDYTKGRSPDMLEPFFPNEVFRYIIVSCFLLVIECVAVNFFPLPFKLVEKPDRISWFLLPVYKLSRLVHNEKFFILILVAGAFAFISWPFLSSDKIYNLVFLKKVKNYNKYHTENTAERLNLWQMPIQFTVVVITLIAVILLCFI